MFNPKNNSAMKKKTLLLAGLCALSLCTCEVQATNSEAMNISICNAKKRQFAYEIENEYVILRTKPFTT